MAYGPRQGLWPTSRERILGYRPRHDPSPSGQKRIHGLRAKTGHMHNGPKQNPRFLANVATQESLFVFDQ